MQLAGTTTVITGASSGIGEQLARQLAARGTNLVLVARREDRLTALRDELTTKHSDLTVTVLPSDLSEVDAARTLVNRLDADGTQVDLLINNAGVGSHEKVVDEDPDRLARQIQLNVGSLVDLTARLLPGMVTRGNGAVINVASTAAFQPIPTMAVYGATKAFVLSFTEALWAETRTSGVRVFALCPGATETEFFDNTGKSFMTRGRQTAEQVATVAVRALDGRSPTVVSGVLNQVSATGYRILPRAVMARVSGAFVKAD